MLTWRNRNAPTDRIAALQQLHPDFGAVAAACRCASGKTASYCRAELKRR